MEKITVNAEYLFEFDSKQQWINKAQSWFANTGLMVNSENLVCISKDGDVLTCGLDFTAAEVMDAYPVKVYRLYRTSNVISDRYDGAIEEE